MARTIRTIAFGMLLGASLVLVSINPRARRLTADQGRRAGKQALFFVRKASQRVREAINTGRQAALARQTAIKEQMAGQSLDEL